MPNKILMRAIVIGIILGVASLPIEMVFWGSSFLTAIILSSIVRALFIPIIFIFAFCLLRAKEEGFLLGVMVFLINLFLRSLLISQMTSMPADTILLFSLSSLNTWCYIVLLPLAGFFGGLLGSRKISLKRLSFILTFTGIIFLTVSGLAVVVLTSPYGLGGFILVIGSGIIILLLIGLGLTLSTIRSRVVAGSAIILVFSGISFILGGISIGSFESLSSNLYYYWGNITHILIFIIKTSFYGSIVLLIAGGIMALMRKQPTLLSSSLTSVRNKEIEVEIKKYEEYLEKLEQLKKEEKISEEAYKKLRTEYEEKLDKLVSEWKK